MSVQLFVPSIDEAAVRDVLNRSRQAKPLGNSPLRRLVWIHELVEATHRDASAIVVDRILSEALTRLIVDRMISLRQTEEIPHQLPGNQAEAWDVIRADFSRENAELEAWSVLYHRYVGLDLDWQMQDIASELGMSARNLRRRFKYGIRRLTEIIVQLETEARARNKRLWLELKLPPADTSDLIGVDRVLSHLVSLLADETDESSVMVVGPGGIGKTTLMCAAVKKLIAEHRFANITWLSLQQVTVYHTVLAYLANDLGFRQIGERNLADLEAALRSTFDHHPTLLVIDDAPQLDDIGQQIVRLNRLIVPGRLLLAGRQMPPAEISIRTQRIEPLTRSAFVTFMERVARERRLSVASYTTETFNLLHTTLGGNPLAGRLIVTQMKTLPLDRIMADLPTLSVSGDQPLFERLFGTIWEALDDDSRRVAMTLVLLPPDGAYWHDILMMVDISPERLDRALARLATESLVVVGQPGPLYMMHGIARLFVEDRAQYPPYDRVYRQVLHAAIEREQVETDLRREDTSTGGEISATTLSYNLSLLHRELQTGSELRAITRLIQQLAPAVRRSGMWAIWQDAMIRVEEQLRQKGAHPADLARVLLELGVAHRWLGDLEHARDYLAETIAFSGESGEFVLQAEALLEMGRLSETMGQPAAAFEAAQRAASVAHRHGAVQLRRQALIQLVDLALRNEQLSKAGQLSQQILDTFYDEKPDGAALSTHGMVLYHGGNFPAAIDYQQQALAAFEADGDLPGMGRAYLRLGMAHHAQRDLDRSMSSLGEGLRIMEQIGDALGRARTLSNLGAVHLDQEHYADAFDLWHEAIELQYQLGDQVGMAHTWYNLAILQAKNDQPEEAQKALGEARAIAEYLGLHSLLTRIARHPLHLDDQSD